MKEKLQEQDNWQELARQAIAVWVRNSGIKIALLVKRLSICLMRIVI